MTTDLSMEYSAFVSRLESLRYRIERIIINRYYDEFDAYELDNLVQAGMVHLWEAYRKHPEMFDAKGDGYWYATAKRGAFYEIVRDHRRRFRQEVVGSGGSRRKVEVVVSSGDLLARSDCDDCGELDEAVLSGETVFGSETEEIQEADRRIDIPCLEATIFAGTNPKDHPMITKILGYMREGLTMTEMAKCAGVNVDTIRCTIRRMRQACGAAQEANKNRKRPGASLDGRIRALREKGLSGPEIARRVGTEFAFVYRRLHTMRMM